jgi:hypothetical protein
MITLKKYMVENVSNKPATGDVLTDYNGDEWEAGEVFDTKQSSDADFNNFTKKYNASQLLDDFKTLNDVRQAGFNYLVAATPVDNKDVAKPVVWVYGEEGLSK